MKLTIPVKVGRVIKYFVFSDLFFVAGWGFIEPIFSVFVIKNIVGATLITVGIVAAIYWFLKSLFQIPIANVLDKIHGEKDDFIALICGLFLAAVAAFAFIFVQEIWELYAVQVLYAFAFALYIPAWSSIFSRHLDKERVSFDWSLDSTVSGAAAGITGIFSGIIAENFGFGLVFFIGGLFSVIAALVLIAAPDLISTKPTHREEVMKDHTPSEIRV